MRVLVSRPRRQGDRTAARLAALGHEALVAPVLEIVPQEAAPPSGRAAGLLLTSLNAVSAALRHRAHHGEVPVFAVGARTAAALAEAGVSDVRCAEGDGAALARLVTRELPRGAALLHLAGRDRTAEPARSLGAAGYTVRVCVVYEARPAGRLPDSVAEALDLGRLDVALHYSRRSAATLVGLAERSGRLERLAGLVHLCLSEETAIGLAPLGPAAIAVAACPDEAALLGLLTGIEPASAPLRSRAAAEPGARQGTIERPTSCGQPRTIGPDERDATT